MKISRRGFLITALATIATAATRKWPAVKWPKPVRRAAGRLLFVDAENGSDLADGLGPNRAFQTIGAAMRDAQPGNTVIVAPGSYHNDFGIDKDEIWLIGAQS